jgi:cytidylate kinase
MKAKVRSIDRIVEEQVRKWQMSREEKTERPSGRPVVTVSREPGSGGRLLAQKLAARYALDLFHQEVLHKMAAEARVSAQMLATLDERGLSVLEDWIASLVHDRHLWPDQYLQHLMKVIGTIGKHGAAVVVGRGANFILPPEGRLRIRVVAPREVRIDNVMREYGANREDAARRIIRTESDRRAFVRKYFYADIDDPLHYDLVINTEIFDLDTAVDMVGSAMERQPLPLKGKVQPSKTQRADVSAAV